MKSQTCRGTAVSILFISLGVLRCAYKEMNNVLYVVLLNRMFPECSGSEAELLFYTQRDLQFYLSM